ncbi:MAG: ATP-grasp domain-containing protein [Gemmatimonadota bacterium]
MSPSVLITCGEQRSALSIVRSLGRAGFRVRVCSSRAPSLAGASRFADEEHVVPDPVIRPEAFAVALTGLIEKLRPDLVIPVTEAALLASLSIETGRSGTKFPFPDLERFAAVCDKTRVFEAARAEGISVPREVVLNRRSDLAGAFVDISFPVVIKPARSVSGNSVERSKHVVLHATDSAALSAAVDLLPDEAFPVHVQQRIVGPGIGVFLLRWEGRTLAEFAHRRIREKPPSGGVSVLCESVEVDPDLLDASLRLLARFEWEGVAMVEYKRDAATGRAYLMEINGRFWGSLELAVKSGVDFPRQLAAAALGNAVEPIGRYRVGVRNRWVWGDVDHLIMRLRRSAAQLSLPHGAPGRVRVVIDFFLAFLWARPEVFQISDPAPAWRETRDWFAALGGSGRGP